MEEKIKEEKTQIEEIEEMQKDREEKREEKKESSEFTEESKEEKEEKRAKKEKIAVLYIQTTKNNTILTLTDMAGNTLSKSSGGQNTKQARLKSSPTIAMFAAKKISEDAKELGITNLYVRIKAQTGEFSPSSASHAVIKSLSRDDFKIISILETTKQPRGGSKPGGGRRGRRV
jgi:small subunit ribosomal protein S11